MAARLTFRVILWCLTLAALAAAAPSRADNVSGCGSTAEASMAASMDMAEAVLPDQPPTPEQIMSRRFPQPAQVGHLVGLPVYDYDDVTLGRISAVVRTDQDKIRLIVPYGGWFGWGARRVAVPIETVVILGNHVNALEFTRAEFEAAPTWRPGTDTPLRSQDAVLIGLGRR